MTSNSGVTLEPSEVLLFNGTNGTESTRREWCEENEKRFSANGAAPAQRRRCRRHCRSWATAWAAAAEAGQWGAELRSRLFELNSSRLERLSLSLPPSPPTPVSFNSSHSQRQGGGDDAEADQQQRQLRRLQDQDHAAKGLLCAAQLGLHQPTHGAGSQRYHVGRDVGLQDAAVAVGRGGLWASYDSQQRRGLCTTAR